MFYVSDNCAVTVFPIITLLASTVSLVTAHRLGRWVRVQILQRSTIYVDCVNRGGVISYRNAQRARSEGWISQKVC